MSFLLSQNATILCSHGGFATVQPSSDAVKLGQSPILVVSDQTTVLGCPFNILSAPSPCVEIEWSFPALSVKLQTGNPLTQSSLGICKSAAGVPQGVALIVSTQSQAAAR